MNFFSGRGIFKVDIDSLQFLKQTFGIIVTIVMYSHVVVYIYKSMYCVQALKFLWLFFPHLKVHLSQGRFVCRFSQLYVFSLQGVRFVQKTTWGRPENHQHKGGICQFPRGSHCIGDGRPPTFNDGNPYFMGPYKPLRTWVDEFIPYHTEIMGV